MNKDPAFLFYPSDFLTGTMFMTDEQVGMYVRILCAQHQHGHLTEDQILSLCHGIKIPLIFEKMERCNDGKYHNKRLHLEIEKRQVHREHQRDNALKRWDKKKYKKMPRHKNGIAMAMPLGNENRDVNEDENTLTPDSGEIIESKNLKYRECTLHLIVSLKQIGMQPKEDERTMEAWDREVRKMIEQDKREFGQIKALIDDCRNHPAGDDCFTWSTNIRSMKTLREKWNENKIWIGMAKAKMDKEAKKVRYL